MIVTPKEIKMNKYIKLFLLFTPILILLAVYWPTNHFFANQYDDTYITYRYAINLAEGHGLVFNAGEMTDSASSFLYTIVLAIFHLIGVDNLELVGGLIGVVSLLIVCVLTYKIALHLVENEKIALFVAFSCGLNGFLSGWALSGMETLPWTAAVLAAIYLMVIDAKTLYVCLAIAVAAFTRFEGIFLVIGYAFQVFNRRKPYKDWMVLASITVLFCIFYIIKFKYYGVWISHAFSMKGIDAYYKSDPWAIINNWISFCSVPAVLGLYVFLTNKKYAPILIYFFISFFSVLFGPTSDWSRYSVHLLPIFYGFSALAISKIYSFSKNDERLAMLAIVAIAMLGQALLGLLFNWQNMNRLSSHQVCRKELGRYINQNIPNSKYIASSDIGAIAYVAIKHKFVDLNALTSSHVLLEYKKGNIADNILEDKNVKYMADTFNQNYSGNKVDYLLRHFDIKKKSGFRPVMDTPKFKCSAGVYSFELVKLEKKPY
jgi:hypothetical protein